MERKSGELWISKESPHVLKYFASGIEYWTLSASTYEAIGNIKKGQILAIASNDSSIEGGVKVAEFPQDFNRLIGVALNDANNTYKVRTTSYGYIKFNRTELENTFITKSDITVGDILSAGNYYSNFGDTSNDGGAGNGWSTNLSTFSGNGAPVYWYQGRNIKTGASSYAMQNSSLKPGSLTFATPAGYKYPDASLLAWGDNSYDVSYKNLPQIGTVYSYEHDGTNITSLIIHVDFSQLNSKIQFSYPAVSLYSYDSINDPETIPIRHGLFLSGSILPYTDVSIIGSDDNNIDGELIKVHPGYSSIISESRTDVAISSDSSFYGKIIGDINYIL